MMSDGVSGKAPAGAAVDRCDSHSSILPYRTNDVATGDQSCLSTRDETFRTLSAHFAL